MHDPGDEEARQHRGIREVEAESVALMIGAAHGMDTAGYTIPYVSTWAARVNGHEPVQVVQATGERVRKTALAILDQLDTAQVGDGTPPGSGGTSSSGGSSSGSSGTSTGTSGSSGSSTTDVTGFVVLTGTDALQVTADVAEADIADVEVGQRATVTLSASGTEVAGTVTSVDSIETVTNNVVEYGVTVTLDRSKGVRLGQSAQVVVTTGAKQQVVRVSSSALTSIGQTTTATVQQSDGTTRTVEVTTGLEGDGYTEVLSGLTAGDTVVLPEQSDTGTGFTFPGAGGGLGRGIP